MEACAIRPAIRNKKGDIVDSILFDLLSQITNNRLELVDAYTITKNPEFIDKYKDTLEWDDNGEPTLDSILKTELFKYVNQLKVINYLNKELDNLDKQNNIKYSKRSRETLEDLSRKANNFNSSSPYRKDFVCNIIYKKGESGEELIGTEVLHRTKENTVETSQILAQTSLNKRLIEVLNKYGISVGALTTLEEKLHINGVTDFSTAKEAANGLIEMIRIAQNNKGLDALPEEFSHFIIEAMNENPLVSRLLSLVKLNNLAMEVLGDDYNRYAKLYKNNEIQLLKETAAKMLADAIKRNFYLQKLSKNLLQRIVDFSKALFGKMNINEIQSAKLEADELLNSLAKTALLGDLSLNLKDITSIESYYQVELSISRERLLLNKALEIELKRLKIYELVVNDSTSEFMHKLSLLIGKLKKIAAESRSDDDFNKRVGKLQGLNELLGIQYYILNTFNILTLLNQKLQDLSKVTNLNEKAGILRNIRNYLYSYKDIATELNTYLLETKNEGDITLKTLLKLTLNQILILQLDLFEQYKSQSIPIFIRFIKPFMGEDITIPFGKDAGKLIKTEDLISIASRDISFMDRWLDSMADSSSYLLKIFDLASKKAKESSRFKTLHILQVIKAAALKLERAGIQGTDWMFERDELGNLTGDYILEIDYRKFNEDKQAEAKRLMSSNPIYKIKPSVLANELGIWEKNHMESYVDENGIKHVTPLRSMYTSKVFAALNPAQLEYYNTVMDIKKLLDKGLPRLATYLCNAVKIRKDLVERVKNSSNVKEGTLEIWESIKDMFIRRSDNLDFGFANTVTDFEGNIANSLPLYFIKMKDREDVNSLSTDVTSTMIAYAAMANDYAEMSNIINLMETGRNMVLDNLLVLETYKGKPAIEKFKRFGLEIQSKVLKPKDSRLIVDRLNSFFEMLVYGKYMKDEGTIGETNIDKGKLANFINTWTSLCSLAMNMLSGISNVATGKVMMRIESFCGEFFSERDTVKGDSIYAAHLPALLGELGSRVQTNKLALWMEYFNVLQKSEEDFRNVDFDRKSLTSKLFKTSHLFFMNNVGEHWMQTRTSLALANTYKMKSPSGLIVNLWDAMEVVPVDGKDLSKGGKLQVKLGFTKEDGSEFTMEDASKFSRKSAAVNQRLHGIYNKNDKNAIQALGLGRMAIMFRKYLKPSLNRRFDASSYNMDLEAWTEGYYRTFGRFLKGCAKDIKNSLLNLSMKYKELTHTEKANIKRASTELGTLIVVGLFLSVLGMLRGTGDDKKKLNESLNPLTLWLLNMTEYLARRLYTEIGALTPGPLLFTEAFKLLKSPAAGINTLESASNLVGLFNPYNYEWFAGDDALMLKGRYKGESKATKLFFESPVIPMNKTIYRWLHPEESIPFFKQ